MMRPFSNGYEYRKWYSENCEKCKKNVLIEGNNYKSQCDIEEAIALGTITGEVPDDIGKRMGNPLDFKCPEFESEE